MSVLRFVSIGESGYVELFCECSALIGKVTLKELGELSNAGITPLCFDCDNVHADEVPQHLLFPDDGQYVLAIGEKHFFVDYHHLGLDKDQGGGWYREIPAVVFLSLAAGLNGQQSLSSSTYLHKNFNIRGDNG